MESAIRYSINAAQESQQRFLHVDVTGKAFRLCRVTNQSKKIVEYETIHTSTKIPAFRAFDWHPVNEDLVVVGQAGGEATLLNIAEGQQDSLSFQVRSQRLCNSVALNTQNLIAAGLDKVRTDFCLNIWDFNQRLPSPGSKGFMKSYAEPLHKLASGEPITSLKFFHHDPQLLVAAVKGQFVRLYDLREPTASNGLQFATRCVHNLAIDWHDENYFASCYPTNDPSVCVWDKRMISRVNTPHMSFGSGASSDGRQPEVSLEFRNAIQSPGVIWSLRFSKAKRGRLGVLSSAGHLKEYDITKDFTNEANHNGHDMEHEPPWDSTPPQDIFLDRVQEIAEPYSSSSSYKDEKSRVVSFDFTTSVNHNGGSQIMGLNGHGAIHILVTRPSPEPSAISSTGQLYKGDRALGEAILAADYPGDTLLRIRNQAEQDNKLKKEIRQARQTKTSSVVKRMSSLADQEWHSDLGYSEENITLNDKLTLTSTQRLRCEAGYLLNAMKNKILVSDSHWLQRLWAWTELAGKIARNGNMTQDNFDLSYVGVYGLWMEDVAPKNRTLGPTTHKLAKIIENLVRRLNLPPLQSTTTEYPANRQICLHVSGLAWSEKHVEAIVDHLVQQKDQVAKAAALAMFASQRKYAYKALRSANASQSHKMLAMAIAGAAKRTRRDDDGVISADDSDVDDDWSKTIASLAEDLTDPYARSILTYVKSGDWASVIEEESLPLKYRVCIALRHLDDSKLTHYISHATKDAVSKGDIEGVILTGTATQEAFELMSNYLQRFGDVQTAVLSLCAAIPRYVDDEKVVRRFTAWKEAYRHLMNGWGLKFDRVRFDIACQNAAVDEAGRRLLPTAKQQINLVCGFCAQGIAHSTTANGETGDNTSASKTVETLKHPLTKEKAAAIGTICPKCGRHLPRCGVCDLWLGVPDDSYLKWYPQQQDKSKTGGGSKGQDSFDLGASISGSIQTALGPGSIILSRSRGDTGTGPPSRNESPRPKTTGKPSSTGLSAAAQGLSPAASVPVSRAQIVSPANENTTTTTKASVNTNTGVRPRSESAAVDVDDKTLSEIEDERRAVEAAKKWDMAMSRFTVLCVKCSHGCHAAHARMWFEKHRVCPVPECSCLCNG